MGIKPGRRTSLDVIAGSIALHLSRGRSEDEAIARASKTHSYASGEVMDMALAIARTRVARARQANAILAAKGAKIMGYSNGS